MRDLRQSVAWWNPQILIIHPQFTQFWIRNPQISSLQPQISFNKPQFLIFKPSSSILSQKWGIFDSKCPQNSGISNKMSAIAACTAYSFFRSGCGVCGVCDVWCAECGVYSVWCLMTKICLFIYRKCQKVSNQYAHAFKCHNLSR